MKSIYTSASKNVSEDSVRVAFPPVLILNLREKIEPEQVPVEELLVRDKQSMRSDPDVKSRVVKNSEELLPVPMYSIEMTWNPSNLCFVLEDKPVTHRVRICNCSHRPMYFLNCGLWGEMARLGASWNCYPHTRNWLAAGLTAEITVKAVPRETAPVPCAMANMQIAAGHLRDNVTGYFSIPIRAKFLKYIPPPTPESDFYE